MPGTNVWSMVFVIVALMVAIAITASVVRMWHRYLTAVGWSYKKLTSSHPPWSGPTTVTIIAIGTYILAATLGWNAMVNVTTSRSNYKVPAEIQEQKKVQESQLPSAEELDQTRAEQKLRGQTKPHKETLDSFDESMKREEEKIRQRSLNKTAPSPEREKR